MNAISTTVPHQMQLDPTLAQLKEHIARTGDQETVQKLEAYAKKWQEQTLHIGFCGLFSAGKSSMINALLGERILPSNPIPTSANVVAIRYGEPKANVYLTSGATLTLDIDQLEDWKRYCTDGDEVKQVEINYPHPLLAQGVVLLDTPGIDSTDPRHQQATEAALHLADVVIFVSDYNYVQSEVNFSFVKRLKERGKYLYLVINQIDKHRDPAGGLDAYLSRLYAGLREWGLAVDGLLCTSLKEPDHPFNMFSTLEQLLNTCGEEKEYLLTRHFKHGLQLLLDQHREYLLEEQSEARETILKRKAILMEKLGEDGAAKYEAYLASLQAPERIREELITTVQDILKNAIVTPYVTTQLAREMIESYQQDFKVGLLFSGKKTEQERTRRRQAFYADLTQRIEAQIEWHIKDALRSTLSRYGIDNQQLLTSLLDWKVTFSEEWVTSRIRTNGVSRDYVYVYLDELKQTINGLYRQKLEELLEKLDHYLTDERKQRFESQQDAHWYAQLLQEDEKLNQLDEEIEAKRSASEQIIAGIKLPHFSDEEQAAINIKLMVKPVLEKAANTDERKYRDTQPNGRNHASYQTREQEAEIPQDIGQFTHLANVYQEAAQMVEQVPPLQPLAKEWRLKAERIRHRRFRVCLFGAFSAGKSSFANALLGDAVLPVSPHPTTAAVNYIVPPTADNPDGTYLVRLKTEEQMLEQIRTSLKRLNLKERDNILYAIRQVHDLDPATLPSGLRADHAFLTACAKGWETAYQNLGQTLRLNHDEYTGYVADERLACFVQDITGHLDVPLTRLGLEIIDTPGADSIYARHTDVTFNFLKEADVIIYLTYYNHAFSQADRNFLDQLGRVKEQFALDKMFFVVNAADLAGSDEELAAVLEHVKKELQRSGLREIRLLPVSSLKALSGEDAGFNHFRQTFFSFLKNELAEGVKAQVEADLKQGFHLLIELRKEAEQALVRNENPEEAILKWGRSWINQLDEANYPSCLIELNNEIAEQIYYINQRLFFNFKRYVDDVFHPAVLSNRSGLKSKLNQCLDELLFNISRRLQDELKACGLRLENKINHLISREVDQWVSRLKQEGFSIQHIPTVDFSADQPEDQHDWTSLNDPRLAHALKQFKQPKQFFEQGGKEKMREELEQVLKERVNRFLADLEKQWKAHYEREWLAAQQAMTSTLKQAIQLVVEGRLAAIKGQLTLAEVDELLQQYRQRMTSSGFETL